jgi:hypothetical protein
VLLRVGAVADVTLSACLKETGNRCRNSVIGKQSETL